MASEIDRPLKLVPLFRERVWGRENLAPYYGETPRKERIGEVWFTFEENMTSTGKTLGEELRAYPELLGTAADPKHPGICPLLVKMLFTTERLSVQVHPDDAYAAEHHKSLGKTEAWYVLDAVDPGEVAVGFRETLDPVKLKEAAVSGEIEDLLDWRKVKPGDVIFTPAGTVHAIGAGLTICEIQENSDITYRLYDYGRPRELHLEHGVKVSQLGPHVEKSKLVPLGPGRDELAKCPYFRIERLRPRDGFTIAAALPQYLFAICTSGQGTFDGESFRAGEARLIPANGREVKVSGAGSEWIVTYTAANPTGHLRVN